MSDERERMATIAYQLGATDQAAFDLADALIAAGYGDVAKARADAISDLKWAECNLCSRQYIIAQPKEPGDG